MSNTLKSKKKPELQALAAELGIDTDGNKSDLEARILFHLSEHIDLKAHPKFSKYFASITGPESPGPVASVAAGSHRRRSVPAKKSTDLGEAISKALTG
jgi:SAP domain